MRKVLITGKNSFIGTAIENWLNREPENYLVETIDMKGEYWRKMDFSQYDVVFHVAGIAHVSSDPKFEELYYKVNRDLAIQTAAKAKAEGVSQFIFMSSIIVYGDSSNSKRIIDQNTLPNPTNFYGKSKLQAEEGIRELESENFQIVVIRPPMIYGKGCKGNYPKLASMAKWIPVFPDFDNERSMLHIDNLSELVKLIIDNGDSGLFFPQNKEYVKTSELVESIANIHGRKLRMIRWMNFLIKRMFIINIVRKIFGNFTYMKSISEYEDVDYRIRTFKESIELTELEFVHE